jgi:hypothetical protein
VSARRLVLLALVAAVLGVLATIAACSSEPASYVPPSYWCEQGGATPGAACSCTVAVGNCQRGTAVTSCQQGDVPSGVCCASSNWPSAGESCVCVASNVACDALIQDGGVQTDACLPELPRAQPCPSGQMCQASGVCN